MKKNKSFSSSISLFLYVALLSFIKYVYTHLDLPRFIYKMKHKKLNKKKYTYSIKEYIENIVFSPFLSIVPTFNIDWFRNFFFCNIRPLCFFYFQRFFTLCIPILETMQTRFSLWFLTYSQKNTPEMAFNYRIHSFDSQKRLHHKRCIRCTYVQLITS